MIEHLSYSSISLYLSCPEAWRRKYIAKEPTFTTPALVFGSAIHTAIEQYIQQSEKPVLDYWSSAWGKAIEGQIVSWNGDTPEQHFNEGVRILTDPGVAYNLSTLKPGKDESGFMVEKQITLRVPGVPVPITGFIDVITADGIPGDFKTSARSWTGEKAANELQPLFYLAAMSQAKMPTPEWRFRHYTIVKTKQPKFEMFEVSHNPKEIVFLFSMIQGVWKAIQNSVFHPNPTGWKCTPAYCDFYADCRGKYL
jgi:putative RecB family exonuclease